MRDALSLLDQSTVLGGGEITEETVAELKGGAPSDVQFELADAVAVGDSRTVFELLHVLVQEGQDLRHLTGDTLSHFRDLLLVQVGAGEPAVLDASPEDHGRLAQQAAKFTTAELARVIVVAAGGADRHAVDDLAAADPGAGAGPFDHPGSRPVARRGGRAHRTPRTPGRGDGCRGSEGDGGRRQAGATRAATPLRERRRALRAAFDSTPAGKADRKPTRERGPRPRWRCAFSGGALGRGQPHSEVVAAAVPAPSGGAADDPSGKSRAGPRRRRTDGTTLDLVFPPGKKFAVKKVQERTRSSGRLRRTCSG